MAFDPDGLFDNRNLKKSNYRCVSIDYLLCLVRSSSVFICLKVCTELNHSLHKFATNIELVYKTWLADRLLHYSMQYQQNQIINKQNELLQRIQSQKSRKTTARSCRSNPKLKRKTLSNELLTRGNTLTNQIVEKAKDNAVEAAATIGEAAQALHSATNLDLGNSNLAALSVRSFSSIASISEPIRITPVQAPTFLSLDTAVCFTLLGVLVCGLGVVFHKKDH